MLPACAESDGDLNTLSATGSDVSRVVLRPGDTLLDHLGSARLVAHPRTCMPPAVAAIATGLLVGMHASFPPAAWRLTPYALLPVALARLVDDDPGLQLWFTVPSLVPLGAGDGPTGFRHQGAPVPTTHELTAELLDVPVVWYPERHSLASLAHRPPEGVDIREQLPTSTEFDKVERGRLRLGREPRPGDLLDRFELGGVELPALVLAAPAVLEFHVDDWQADALQVAVGLVDRGWLEIDGALQRIPSRSDGVTVAVEVDRRRVWSRAIPSDGIGGAWIEEAIDLSAWHGRSFSIRLVTEMGPNDHAVSDYAVWGALRAVGTPKRAPEHPHVVLIDIDTLRADRLAAYRNRERITTPGLDAWVAERAVAYTDSVATAPWTLPSTVSMLTGLAVHQHGVDSESEALSPGATTLATRLGEAGYETLALVGSGFLAPQYGWGLGFDRYESRDPRAIDWSVALERLVAPDSERPLFVFLHTFRVHQPYPYDPRFVDPDYMGDLAGQDVDRGNVFVPVKQGRLDLTAADRAYVEALYDALVVDMDEAVSAFLQELHTRVDPDRLLVVFTSDHGEAFLEHDVLAHGQALWGELLRVPLAIHFPGGGPGVDPRPVSGMDVVPTVLDVVGLSPDPSLPGRSVRAPPDADRVRVAEHDGRRRAVQSGGYKLLEDLAAVGRDTTDRATGQELYFTAEDPGERHDRAAELPQVLEDLQRRRDWFLATFPRATGGQVQHIHPGAAEVEQLQALGYLSDG